MARGTHNSRFKLVEDASDFRRWNTTVFNESRIAEKSQQFILNANIPLSSQRDKQTTSNNGSVTKVNAEYRLRATSDTNSTAELGSRRRGNYISGNVAEAGMGIRVPTQPTGDAVIRWGYYDNESGTRTGFYYEYTADGLFAIVEDAGTVTKRVPQDQWNIEKFNSGDDFGQLTLNQGYIFQISFVYYGYGPIVFEIGKQYLSNRYNMIAAHLVNVDENTSIKEPNLPLTIEVDSGTSGQQFDVFVGGRQFSTFGKQRPIRRQVGAYRLEQGSIGTTFYPLVSFREKTGFENILVELNKLSVISDADLVYEIRVNANLTGASFGTPNNYTSSEVATEWDVSATAVTNGETVKSGLLVGGNKDDITSDDLPDRTVFEEDVYTLCVRTISGTNATVTAFFQVEENW